MREAKHTEDDKAPRCRADTQILEKTRRKGEKVKRHSIRVKNPEGGTYNSQLTYALYGCANKDSKPINDIRKGLPAKVIGNLAKRLHTTESYLLPIIGISDRTWQRRRKESKPFAPVESDRLYRLAKIYARAREVFEDEEIALNWLKSKNRALDDVPIMLLDTEAGTDMVERVLTRIEHGVYS